MLMEKDTCNAFGVILEWKDWHIFSEKLKKED